MACICKSARKRCKSTEDHIVTMMVAVIALATAITIADITTAVAAQEVVPTVARMVVPTVALIGIEGRWKLGYLVK